MELTDEELIESYRVGRTLTELGLLVGRSADTVSRRMSRAGYRVRRRGRTAEAVPISEHPNVVARYVTGESMAALGRHYQVSDATIKRILRRNGVDLRRNLRERHGNWSGGRTVSGEGYVYVLVDDDDPMASMRNSIGYVAEHRLVVARDLGRPLRQHETVHHLNGRRDDNRRENLQLRSSQHGRGVALRCAVCGALDIEHVAIKE